MTTETILIFAVFITTLTTIPFALRKYYKDIEKEEEKYRETVETISSFLQDVPSDYIRDTLGTLSFVVLSVRGDIPLKIEKANGYYVLTVGTDDGYKIEIKLLENRDKMRLCTYRNEKLMITQNLTREQVLKAIPLHARHLLT